MVQREASTDTVSNPLVRTAGVDFESSPTPLLVLSPDGVIKAASQAALALLHWERRLTGADFISILDEGSRDKSRALMAAASHGPTALHELNVQTGDGQVVMISFQALPLAPTSTGWGPQGDILLLQPMASMVATTERLIALNRRLDALFTIAAHASRSLGGRDLLREALGVTLAELDLQAAAVFLIDAPSESERGELAAVEQPILLHLAAHQGWSAEAAAERNATAWIGRRAHEQMAAEEQFVLTGSADELGIDPANLAGAGGLLLSIAGAPLRSEGRLVGWLVAVSDRYRAFTAGALDTLRAIGDVLGPPVENARLYEELIETSGQLQAVLEGIDSGVLLVDRAGIIRYANGRLGTLLESDVTAWPGMPRASVIDRQLAPLPGATSDFDGQLWEFTGPPRRVLRQFTDQVADRTSAPLGSIEVYTDVTTMEEMNRLKDEFVAAAAHDLKTPVTAVKGYAQIALRLARRNHDPRLVQQLEMVNARSDHLTFLMNSLLDLSRLQAGRLNLELERLPVAELVRRVAQHFDLDLQRRGRSLVVDQPAELLEVEWDSARIERVLINLVDNAIKYSPDGGAVELRIRRVEPRRAGERDEIEIAVTDQGIGIPAEERERIFDRFYRMPRTIEDGFKGTGLGLYICRRVVEAHGGQIGATDALHGGDGTTVFVVLPSSAPAQGAA